ncbi:MAG: DnaJ domain-containing protein [Myxococcota bacterium]|nr:DnaJ domain-containing protein [Myxococcota bacterium]
MAGAAQLPEPLAQGDLERTPFAHLLLYIQGRGLDGTLVIWKPEPGQDKPRQDRIRFSGGVPQAGRLIERASRLERGMLPLFARTDGPYAFYADTDLVGDGGGVIDGPADVPMLIAASLRGSSRDDVVAQVVAGFGEARLRLRRDADIEALQLLPDERATVQLLRADPTSVAKLTELSPLEPRQVQRIVYLLAITKSVEPWDGSDAKASGSRPKQPTPPRPQPRTPKPAKSETRAAGAPEAVEPPPPGLSSEHRALWQEIAQRAEAIETENYYEMLGITKDVSTAAIQKAYFGLVKKWHPDRLPRELEPLRPVVERIFRYLTRAQETLSDDETRGKYLATVQDGGGTPEAERQLGLIIQAAMEFRKVEVLMRRREWDEALALLEPILEVNAEEPDYQATRAWILFQKSGPGPAVLGGLDAALALNDSHDKAHYYKGMVLKRTGKRAEAAEHFRKAAELNPKNIDAVREVRLLDMRGSTPPSKGGGSGDSFFGKLFGGKKK